MIDKSENIDIEKVVNHWIVTSLEDFNIMIDLFNSKTFHGHYLWDTYQPKRY